jgi:aspartyl-tRNA(Asn)/glutamyl-tRNA(Gln) amidotransferase subunit A
MSAWHPPCDLTLSEPVTIEGFAQGLRGRRFSAAEFVDDLLRRIAADNPRLNAFILVTADMARQQARQADRELQLGRDRGPLHGVPISVKDLFDVAGTPTTAASRVRDGHIASADAPSIRRVREAGAVIIGKTNLHEFAFGTTNDDSAYGPARNPHDPARSPGGSSGGSAASVAAGLALASIGSDTGGSIRIPAAACGIVGLKPTFGEVSLDGAIPLSRALDHAGPLVLSVADAALMFGALSGGQVSKPLAPQPIAELRFAVLREYFCDVLDDEVRARFDEAIDSIRAAGATVTERRIDHAPLTAPAYMHITFGDAAAYHAATIEAVPHLYTQGVRQRLELARYVLAEDYVRALDIREALKREVDAALEGETTLVLPTLPIPAPTIGASSVDIRGESQPVRALMLRLTQLFNLTGHPAISIPCGRTSAGLPCGLQLVGATGRSKDLLAVASAVESVVGRTSDSKL